VLSVALTPHGDWVLSGSKDRGVQFWDPHTGVAQLMLQGHKNSGMLSDVCPSRLQANFFKSFRWHLAQLEVYLQRAVATCARVSGGKSFHTLREPLLEYNADTTTDSTGIPGLRYLRHLQPSLRHLHEQGAILLL
jgi:hypothetical protein